MMQAINPSGRKVGILASQWPALEKQGFTLPVYYEEFPASEEAPQWIFVRRPIGGLGDSICMEPVIRGLHIKWPGVKIALDTPKKYWGLWEPYEQVEEIYDVALGKSTLPAACNLKALIDLDCPCDQYESSTGYRPQKDRTTIFCETARVEPSSPILSPSPSELEFAEDWLIACRLPWRGVIGIQPISAQPEKDWVRFAALAYVLADMGYYVVIFHDKPISGIITHSNIIVVNPPRVENLLALCSLMRLLITPDSALFHIGGALGIPTLGLFGPTNGRLTSRWYTSTEIIQSAPFPECPCHFYDPNKNETCLGGSSHCMLQLTVEEVLSKVEDMLCR